LFRDLVSDAVRQHLQDPRQHDPDELLNAEGAASLMGMTPGAVRKAAARGTSDARGQGAVFASGVPTSSRRRTTPAVAADVARSGIFDVSLGGLTGTDVPGRDLTYSAPGPAGTDATLTYFDVSAGPENRRTRFGSVGGPRS
jgi:hypothetical protein